MIIAIDPGPVKSAYVIYDESGIGDYGHVPNDEIQGILDARQGLAEYELVIEMIASYGMAVGATTFDTCVWIGRFLERWRGRSRLAYRVQIKTHLCHSARAKDTNVRQALIDRLGAPGTKKAPGPTFGIANDVWSALAVAIYASDTRGKGNV